MQEKITFSGEIISVQPRSNVWRYKLDNRTHSLAGYNLFLFGIVGDGEERPFSVAISERQQEKYQFHIGDKITGTAWTKMYPKREYADYYRSGGFKKTLAAQNEKRSDSPPWRDEVASLSVYEWRGCRMLDTRRWRSKCFQCKWAAMANVTIEYNWGVTQKLRFESFCYGPKTCKYYLMGKARGVPYKDEGTFYDEGWLDDICTERRGPDD